MTPRGYKLTPEQIENLRKGHMGQKPWNTGKGGCKRGHSPEYYIQSPSGVMMCMDCKRENGFKYRDKNRKRINLQNRVDRYKVSIDDFYRLYNLQDGCCAICGDEIDLEKCRIDHNHKTCAVRGLLCTSCNTGIGLLKDSPDVAMAAYEYLKKHDTE